MQGGKTRMTIRQDAWSGDDDLILAEVVLRHIREGSTQLAAFEEVGERLSRTSAACGFRWNSAIRKKYESAIALAKKQRAAGKEKKSNDEPTVEQRVSEEPVIEQVEESVEPLTMERVLAFLAEYHENKEKQVSIAELKQLEEENERLKKELEEERQKHQVIAEDYRTLVAIMERARKLSYENPMTTEA